MILRCPDSGSRSLVFKKVKDQGGRVDPVVGIKLAVLFVLFVSFLGLFFYLGHLVQTNTWDGLADIIMLRLVI